MGFTSVLGFAHKLVGERLRPGDIAIDATVGRGNDMRFLAGCVGSGGHVYGFDVQQEALNITAERLRADQVGPERVTLLLESHEHLARHIPAPLHGRVGAVMFNLGYLPGGEDPSIITSAGSTIPAMESALTLLRKGGIMTVVLYPGHEGGGEEAAAVDAWLRKLPQSEVQTLLYRFVNRNASAPYLIAAEKL